jgi:hypothetical protein
MVAPKSISGLVAFASCVEDCLTAASLALGRLGETRTLAAVTTFTRLSSPRRCRRHNPRSQLGEWQQGPPSFTRRGGREIDSAWGCGEV